MHLTELVYLLYASPERWRTVEASIERWMGDSQLGKSDRRALNPRSSDPVTSAAGEDESGRAHSLATRIWAVQPDLLRWEVTTTPNTMLAGVKNGRTFWTRDATGAIHSNAAHSNHESVEIPEETLLYPSRLLARIRFEIVGSTMQIGREAVLVRGTPLRRYEEWPKLYSISDELQMIVDIERGILLEIAYRADRTLLGRMRVLKIAIDEDISRDLFEPLTA